MGLTIQQLAERGLSARQAAEILGTTSRSLRNWVHRGLISGVRFDDGGWHFLPDDIERARQVMRSATVVRGAGSGRSMMPVSFAERGKRARLPLVERIAAYAMPEPNSGCVLFMGHLLENGYGRVLVDRRVTQAHRVAYEAEYGPIPPGLVIDHLCRVRSCINPKHLEVVTQRINILRGTSPSARNITKTACLRGHEFTKETTKRARDGHRACRVCEWVMRTVKDARERGRTLTFEEVEARWHERKQPWTREQIEVAIRLLGHRPLLDVLAAVNAVGPRRTRLALKNFAVTRRISMAVSPGPGASNDD